jgi:hypothetical protein
VEKYKTKKRVDYSIDKDTIIKFDKLAKEKAINKSGLIELFIKNWIKENIK